jgi:uncharacterized protein
VSDQNNKQTWYKKGLKFKCTECGKCCTGSPGHVFLNKEEAINIANELKISVEEFVRLYTRQIGKKLALKERKISEVIYDCIFLKDKKCTIYKHRPKQCCTFPWWPQNLKSKESWENLAAECEGLIQEDAPVIPFEKIQEELHKNN